MNRKFTKLMAALALLTFLIPPMVGWGQTNVATLSGTTTSGGTKSTNFTSKTTYYQDGGNTAGETRYLSILNNNAYWTTTCMKHWPTGRLSAVSAAVFHITIVFRGVFSNKRKSRA